MMNFAAMSAACAATAHHAAQSHHVPAKRPHHAVVKSPHKPAVQQQKRHQMLQQHKKKKTAHKKKVVVHKRKIFANDRTAIVDKPVTVNHYNPFSGLFNSFGSKLVTFVLNTVSNLRYSSYKLGGTHFDKSNGVYIVDCSDYVDKVLKEVYPNAFYNLVDATGAEKPTTEHYYDFFSGLPQDPSDHWTKVDAINELEPGDILVFRYKNSLGRVRGGHVMVVMDKPIRDDDAFLVRVSDSAATGHSEDTRPSRTSGIGIGTLLLKANAKTGRPYAYAWSIGARWNANVNIAMARPVTA